MIDRNKILFGVNDMRKRLLSYLNFMDQVLSMKLPPTASYDYEGEHSTRLVRDEIPTRKDYEKLMQLHLDQIAFFQHERLIHLLVTMLFAVLAVGIFFLNYLMLKSGEADPMLLILLILVIILLIPYIYHYYLLENGVQKMYRQYDELQKRVRC